MFLFGILITSSVTKVEMKMAAYMRTKTTVVGSTLKASTEAILSRMPDIVVVDCDGDDDDDDCERENWESVSGVWRKPATYDAIYLK